MKYIHTTPEHLYRIYDTKTEALLGGVRALDEHEFGEQTRCLRAHFGFDGFVGASLRVAVEAADDSKLALFQPSLAEGYPSTWPWLLIVIV